MSDKKYISVDGNTAAALIGYALSDVACIFPITPSTPMAELCDEWAAKGTKNVFGNTVQVTEMQSEAGAAGAVHGSASVGALTTTYTASQGLLLMIPNMYKIAGECLPVVFHVSARTLAAQAINIFGDHQDVMACRQTGFCMLASNNVQEAHDMALIAHIAAYNSSLPFLHFFDGFRTSHEINKIEEISYDVIKQMLPMDKINAFRANGHNPNHPKLTGPCENGDTYFQNREANNKNYDDAYVAVENAMAQFKELTGREYHPFEYVGAADATDVIVVMCSGADTVHESLNTLVGKEGKKYGLVKVHLYRPFNGKAFVDALPKTVKTITVLDRTKEPGSIGEPLYLDVVMALNQNKVKKVKVLSGRFGVGGKEFTPTCVYQIFNNSIARKPIKRFTVGIKDDVTHLSLRPLDHEIELAHKYFECKFWGLGSDGTISANKSSIKIVGNNTNKYIQGYFEYDSKKSGGLTISHLRMADEMIRSPYFLQHADFIAIHNFTYVNKYDVLEGLKPNGNVLLNSVWPADQINDHLPKAFKEKIVALNAKLYTIDAYKVAGEAGLGNRINVIMQSCFFKITNIIPYDVCEKQMKDAAIKAYSKKGDAVVQANMKAIDAARDFLFEVDTTKFDMSKNAAPNDESHMSKFFKKFCAVIDKHEGDKLPVSAFKPDGAVPTGTTKYEKRCIGNAAPEWRPENCFQCGQCTLVCPHAAIRSGVFKKEDLKNAPASFKTKAAIGVPGAEFRIQVSAADCTGCGSCTKVCVANRNKEKQALVMKPINDILPVEQPNWDFFTTLRNVKTPFAKTTVKGIQFEAPYFEFSGACAGCGETPYIKTISQLFGKRMVIANATGCSSIYGGAFPTVPYCTDKNGKGPSWSNSLFEDNAEYGLGMALGLEYRRNELYAYLDVLAKDANTSAELKKAIADVVAHKDAEDIDAYIPALAAAAAGDKKIINNLDQLSKKSIWIIGGDGWAYDIGFGGLDHVLASGKNVNILVVDTEVYSNTGGQASKSSPMGAVAKFTAAGKPTRKKDLGAIAMTYKDVYVAQVAMGADQQQFIKAISEAEAYNGVSLIIAYAPCINHGFNMSNSQLEMKKAVEAGYWQLYRYNPAATGKKFTLDSTKTPQGDYVEFLKGEARYASLVKKMPEHAAKLFAGSKANAAEKLEGLIKLDAGEENK